MVCSFVFSERFLWIIMLMALSQTRAGASWLMFAVRPARITEKRSPSVSTTWNGDTAACSQSCHHNLSARPFQKHPGCTPSWIRLFTSSNNDDVSIAAPESTMRLDLLQNELGRLGIDTNELHHAVLQSMQSPTNGYDARFGKSAIRCYRSFVFAKNTPAENDLPTIAAASRCARQVDFLIKRHKSREAEWIRHTDTATSRQTFPLILVLDNVRSAFNVGSLFRTADACGCMQMITTGITPHPNGSGADKLRKCALGADLLLSHKHFDTTLDAVQHLQRKNWTLVGMETTERSVLYSDVLYPRSDNDTAGIALVLGNEVTGVDTEIIPLFDQIVEIPMFGAKNSLNIAACAPVVLYEILRQWEATKRPPQRT